MRDKCDVCGKGPTFFTELYDPDHVFNSGEHVTVNLCSTHHKRMIKRILNEIIVMRWAQEDEE